MGAIIGVSYRNCVAVVRGTAQLVLNPVEEGFQFWFIGYTACATYEPAKAVVWRIQPLPHGGIRPTMLAIPVDGLELGESVRYSQRVTRKLEHDWEYHDIVLRIGIRRFEWSTGV